MSELAAGQTVQLPDGRKGVVRFVGQTYFAPGDWIGVELDDDTGKNDGSVQGERYFDCAMGHGMFVRPATITIVAEAPPPQAAKPPARKPARPSSLFTGGAAARAAAPGLDSGLARRRSLNAPSPSPGPKVSRPSSIARSPTRSPTKQISAASSTSNSRTGTPSNARPTAGAKTRPSVGPAARTSMGPPPPMGPRATRPGSFSSNNARATGAPSRTLSGRLSSAPAKGRTISVGSASGADAGAVRGVPRTTGSPRKSDDEQVSSGPGSTSPSLTRTGVSASASRTASTAGPNAKGSANTAALTKEIEDLKAKLRVLDKKRLEDREKLRNLEKLQSDRDKFERIIQTLQIKFQPQQQENMDLKRQLKEAETRLESIESMQAEHESSLELATLDREMAEETAEVLRMELDALKEKTEELELEVEILREENGELNNGMSADERASTSWLQMERNNERLREALIRLRDLTQQQEEELKDQIKSLEEDLRDFDTVKADYATSQEKLVKSEATVDDLRQQLDNALGAEDMIEDLTERNMSQTEQIEELKAVIEDLESLKEINDELEINHVQNEREMQEELDLRDSLIAEQARRATQQDETMEDMEYTLSRFRDLVSTLQSDIEDMRASHAVTETESDQLNSRSRDLLDLNMKLQISAAKAQVKTIDLELRRLEAQEAEQHLEIVQLFLPESYQSDRDSVLALLRFKRLAFKANMLHNFLKERSGTQAQSGHEDDIFYGCDAVDKLTWVSAMCDRFVNAISHCSLEQFARYEGALYELEPVERALNGWIDGLRRDDLKEQQCADELQRTIALMSHLGEVHIADGLESYADDAHMKMVLIQSRLESAAATFNAIKAMVHHVVPPISEEDELAQYFVKRTETVVTQTRSTKVIAGKAVRALEDLKMRSLSLLPETKEAFAQCDDATSELAELARKIGLDLYVLLHDEGRAEPYTYVEVQACAQRTALAVASSSESDLFSTYLGKLRAITGQISDLSSLSTDLSQTQEFERSEAPWLLRGRELKLLRAAPADAEEELRRLKDELADARRLTAQHKEDLETATLKIDTLGSRMRDATAKAERLKELEVQLQSAHEHATSLQEDIEKQDRELKTLEADCEKWKKAASDSRLTVGTVHGSDPALKAGQERAVATAREMDALAAEIASLQSAIRYLREDNHRARLTEQHSLDWLAEPLRKTQPMAEQRRALVVAESKDALGELVKLTTAAKVYSLSSLPEDKLAWRPARSTPQYHAAKQQEDYTSWKAWQNSVLQKSKLLLTVPLVHSTVKPNKSPKASAAAKLRIHLSSQDGKVIPGLGREVKIIGSREWEGLHGRYAVV